MYGPLLDMLATLGAIPVARSARAPDRAPAGVENVTAAGTGAVGRRTRKAPRPARCWAVGLRLGGRYWVRTSDLSGVVEPRYPSAKRPRAGPIPASHRPAPKTRPPP